MRELGVVVFLTGFGIPAEAALTTSLLVGVCLVVIGLPGGLLWLTSWDITPATHERRDASPPGSIHKLQPNQSLRCDTLGEDR